ncbi:predicted protein, partial [Nematostella vectensis]
RLAQAKQSSHMLNVVWNDDTVSKYSYIYLRDHCLCSTCYHPTSEQRLTHMKNLDLKVLPSNVHVNDIEGKLSITWDDGHVSEFDSKWLLSRAFTDKRDDLDNKEMFVQKGVKLWYRDFDIPHFSFGLVLGDEQSLLDWMEALHKYGLVIMSGAPRELGQVHRIGSAVGFLRKTFYGSSVALRSEPQARSLAYTGYELQPHTDLPYYEFKPSVILLHCIDQVRSSGGENTFVDGYSILKAFRNDNPDGFDLLASTPVLHRVKGVEPTYGEFEQLFARPIIELDVKGRIRRINFNDPLREEFLDTPAEQIPKVYRAYHKLTQMFYEPKFIVRNKMAPGDICAIDNDRLLHGRSAFEVKSDDLRLLEQAYIDWDIIRSKMKILTRKIR